MKKYLKVMLILVVALSILSTVVLAAPATNPFEITVKNDTDVNNKINSLAGSIIGVIQTVGYAVAVIMVLTTGIQYLMGTPAKKQELKGKLWSIVIGAILLIGGMSILGVLNTAINNAI